MVNLKLSHLLLMASLHLCNVILELLKIICVCHSYWWRIGAFKRDLASEARLSANHG